MLQVAESSKASAATTWIKERQANELICRFITTNSRRKIAQMRLRTALQGATMLQAVYRGRKARLLNRSRLLFRLESSKLFEAIWKDCVDALSTVSLEILNWSSIREQQDFIKPKDLLDDDDELVDTMERLDIAMSTVVNDMDNSSDDKTIMNIRAEASDCAKYSSKTDHISEHLIEVGSSSNSACTHIQLTSDVVKWLKQGDCKYREFFARRMKQLSSGDRSRILAKRLKGSKTTIYETYLEQKSGFRILWTIEGSNLLVWYVAKHKNVSRLMRLIDDSESRSTRSEYQQRIYLNLKQDSPTIGVNDELFSTHLVTCL